MVVDQSRNIGRHLLAGSSTSFTSIQKVRSRQLWGRGCYIFHHWMHVGDEDRTQESLKMEDPSFRTNTGFLDDLRHCLWHRQRLCHESRIHGSSAFGGYNYHGMSTNHVRNESVP